MALPVLVPEVKRKSLLVRLAFGTSMLALTMILLALFTACAPVKFEASKSVGPLGPQCNGTTFQCGTPTCANGSCEQQFTLTRDVTGDVDVLIVDDNSGSMSFEQNLMASRFSNFLTQLNGYNYRVGITTTDISITHSNNPVTNNGPKAANGFGAWQDGNLLDFGAGTKYITPSTVNKEILFSNTVKRNETLNCELNNYSTAQCPSTDERGVFAAHLAMEKNEGNWVRPSGHLAVIMLSDEDERGISNQASINILGSSYAGYLLTFPQETKDNPNQFVNLIRSKYPEKTFSTHTISVRPGDTACRNAQTSQNGNPNILGVEGYVYENLRQLTGGIQGNICANDYGTQLSTMGSYVVGQALTLPFSCRPINDEYTIKVNGVDYKANTTVNWTNLTLSFNPNPSIGSHIELSYKCSVSI